MIYSRLTLFHISGTLPSCILMFRNKLASALANWHPADRSARSILAPWAEVFTKGSMNAFLLNNIIPKLEAALLHLPINPINQVNTSVFILKGL